MNLLEFINQYLQSMENAFNVQLNKNQQKSQSRNHPC